MLSTDKCIKLIDFFEQVSPPEFAKYLDVAQYAIIDNLVHRQEIVTKQDMEASYWLRDFRNLVLHLQGIDIFE